MKKWEKILSEKEIQYIMNTILESDSIENTVLKSHLYIEYWIDKLLLSKLHKPHILLSKVWQFSLKIDLLESLGYLDYPLILAQLRALNNLRNELSHQIFVKDIDKKISIINFQEIYGFGSDYDLNNPNDKLKALFLTLLTQIANVALHPDDSWALDALQ